MDKQFKIRLDIKNIITFNKIPIERQATTLVSGRNEITYDDTKAKEEALRVWKLLDKLGFKCLIGQATDLTPNILFNKREGATIYKFSQGDVLIVYEDNSHFITNQNIINHFIQQ